MAGKTTTLPLGCHLSIYKSLQQHVLTKEETEALPQLQTADLIKCFIPDF